MNKEKSYNFDVESKDNSKHGKGKGFFSRNRTLIVVLVIIAVVALGLGLGLGLGLNSDSPSATGCTVAENSVADNSGTDWKLEIPAECPHQPNCPAGRNRPTLIVLSLDGFRADYLLRNMTPTLDYLIKCGVHVPYMRAVFPTKTFPNHYTIATGLYPESHGIIDNKFYDPVYKAVFNYGGSNNDDNRWWHGDPVWNTAKRAGRKVASMMWPGTDVNIGNMRLDVCYNYNQGFNLDDRVKTILSWFDGDPSTYPDLVMAYFEQPDSAGHAQGPFGDQVRDNLTYVDGLVNQLMNGLKKSQAKDCINYVILADHGMGLTDCDRTIDLSEYIATNEYTVYTGTHAKMTSQYFYASRQKSTVNDNPDPIPVETTLSKLECQHYNTSKDWYVRFHRKQDLPRRYHYSNNRCIDEIVMDLEEDYYLADFRGGKCNVPVGSHGADNTYKSMHALFVASGPSFKPGSTADSFENIELYNFLCETLEIEPSPNNGTNNLLSPFLKEYKYPQSKVQASLVSEDCPFPDDFAERERIRNGSDCVPSSSCLNSVSVEEADSRLNDASDNVDAIIKKLLAFGAPTSSDSDICILAHEDYVSGYNKKYHLPLWTAFLISQSSPSSILNGQFRSDTEYINCTRADVRLSGDIDCSDYHNAAIHIVGNLAFPPGFASSNDSIVDGFLSSNLVPMYEGFKTGVWRRMLHSLEEYAAKYGTLQVLFGPIFDYNADGMNDAYSNLTHFTTDDKTVPIPSHYFAVVSVCNSTVLAPKDCANSTRVLSFILPHTQSDNNCRDQLPVPDEYLRQNTARVRDVELLTGFSLFGDMSTYYRLKLLTYLNEEIWTKFSWLDTDNGDCPPLDAAVCPPSYQTPPLLLISLDGYRSDYLKKKLSPVLDRLNRCGVSTPYMKSIYPTLTFPNHHTISTGLYPESHGIIDNSMYDLKLKQSFYLGSPNAMNPKWWFGEPIWNTLGKNSKDAMTFFWPGSDVEIGGRRPTEYVVYDGSVPYSVRVDTVLKWLNGSANGVYPELVVLYLSKVDEAGHEGGSGSFQVDEAIEAVDKALQQLMDGIYRLKMHQCINMIVVSDHGMSDISCSRSVEIKDFFSEETMSKMYVYPGAAGRISNEYARPNDDYIHIPKADQVPLNHIIDTLKCVSSNMVALNKLDMPRRHHYINQDRIDDVLLVMADTWLMSGTSPWCPIKGQHGWDPEYYSMQALFIGYGPYFKDRTEVETFENIELYNLMANLTGVPPAPNNGTEGSLYHLLRKNVAPPSPEPGLDYMTCSFPVDDNDYQQRANLTITGCQCSESSSQIKIFDSRLNLTSSQGDNLETIHLSHGIPARNYNDSVCVLHHSDFVSGFSHQLKMPVWSSFNLTSAQVSSSKPTSINCTRPDVRLSLDEQNTCADYQKLSENGTVPVFLFPPEWSSSSDSVPDTMLLSNQVPMHESFITDVWSLLINYFANLTKSSGHLQVVFGPIFDYDGNGLQDDFASLVTKNKEDILIPSHYFAIALRCRNVTGDCSDMNYDPLTFILPHWDNSRSENCLSMDQFLRQNVARIRDVELLSGFRFLTQNPTQISIQRRVQTPEKLWS